MSDKAEQIMKRKEEGIKIPLEKEVEVKGSSTYLDCVKLIHNALPELNLDEIDTSTEFLGHKFSAPILIDSMTGGAHLAGKINENLAVAAEELQLGMGVGSQRAGLVSNELSETYAIARKKGPSIFLMANIGGAQLARGLNIEDAKKIISMINANALAVHLNPIQELIQPEGEPQFKGVLPKIRELVRDSGVPVIVKEVGGGISKEVALRLEIIGVSAINVAGFGGTSWTEIERIRAESMGLKEKAELGELFGDWGIPTAAALIEVSKAVKVPIIASGGIKNGLEIAKSIALGARLCGMARPLLKQADISKDAVASLLRKTILELKAAMYLVGAKDISSLAKTRYVITSPLREWVSQVHPDDRIK